MTVPWMPLLRNVMEGEGAGRLIVALATVDSAGMPQVRSVVCRRLTDDGSLWITSDSRSAKNAQLAANPQASAAYWARASRQQFRFSGPISIRMSADDPERRQIWREMSPETRAAFFWPAPGAARAPDEAFNAIGANEIPPETFTLLELAPAAVDYLNVSHSPHLRRRWIKDSRWQVEDINP